MMGNSTWEVLERQPPNQKEASMKQTIRYANLGSALHQPIGVRCLGSLTTHGLLGRFAIAQK